MCDWVPELRMKTSLLGSHASVNKSHMIPGSRTVNEVRPSGALMWSVCTLCMGILLTLHPNTRMCMFTQRIYGLYVWNGLKEGQTERSKRTKWSGFGLWLQLTQPAGLKLLFEATSPLETFNKLCAVLWTCVCVCVGAGGYVMGEIAQNPSSSQNERQNLNWCMCILLFFLWIFCSILQFLCLSFEGQIHIFSLKQLLVAVNAPLVHTGRDMIPS